MGNRAEDWKRWNGKVLARGGRCWTSWTGRPVSSTRCSPRSGMPPGRRFLYWCGEEDEDAVLDMDCGDDAKEEKQCAPTW